MHGTVNQASVFKEFFGDGSDGNLDSNADIIFDSILGGDVVVKQYESVIINEGHKMSLSNNSAGLIIYSKSDIIINGEIDMNAKGHMSVTTFVVLPRFGKINLSGIDIYSPTLGLHGGAGGKGGGGGIYSGNGQDGLEGFKGKGGYGGGGGGGGSYYASTSSRYGYAQHGGSYNDQIPPHPIFAGAAGLTNVSSPASNDFPGTGGGGGQASGAGSDGGGAGGSSPGGGGGGGISWVGDVTTEDCAGEDGNAFPGGIVILVAKGSIIIGNNGSVNSKGGNGGKGGNSGGNGGGNNSPKHGAGGGGGGGGGGVIIALYGKELINSGSINVEGGLGGFAGSPQSYPEYFYSGVNGTPGGIGSIFTSKV